MLNNKPIVLIKLSGEVLGLHSACGVNAEYLDRLTLFLGKLSQSCRLCIVVGGGNWVRTHSPLPNQVSENSRGVVGDLAGIMNAMIIADTLSQSKPVTLYTTLAIESITPYSSSVVVSELNDGKIAIVTGGMGHSGFTYDSLGASVAVDIGASMFIKGTDVDGIYDDDPKINKLARKIAGLKYTDALSIDSIKVMDKTAMAILSNKNIPTRVINITDLDKLNIANTIRSDLYIEGTSLITI